MTEYRVQPCISDGSQVQNENDLHLNQARRPGREVPGLIFLRRQQVLFAV